MAYDVNYPSVSLLLHGNGTSGSTTFTDVSPTPKTVTAVGNAQVSATQSKFGGASIAFDGTGDYLTVPHSTEFSIQAGEFTLEAWVYRTASGVAHYLLSKRNDTITNGWEWRVNADNTLQFFYTGGSSLTSSGTVPSGQWVHLVTVRSGSTFTHYIDGVASGSVACANGTENTTDTLKVGVDATLASGMNGYIDELRITNGVARYTAAFTAPTAEFPTSVSETATAALVAPSPSLEAFGGGYANLTGPSAWIYAGDIGHITAALTAPSPHLSTAVRSSYGENAIFATAPSPTLLAYTGDNANLTAPSPTLTSVGTGTALLSAALTAPSPTLSATSTSTGILSAALTAPRPNLVGYGGTVCSITGPMGTLTATGTTGSTLSARITVPMAQLTATVTRQGSMSALLTAPSPRMGTTLQAYLVAPGATLTAIGSATITATYEAYALNLNHASETNDELTRYTNFPFTQVVRYQNSYYGVNGTGLYLLEGTTDDGTAIDWSIKTGITDFDSPQLKTVTYAYFGGRLGPGATVSIYPSEPDGQSYDYTTPRGQTAQNYRQQFGRGIKARYFAIGASGSDSIELDTLDLTVATLKRRI